MELYYTQHPDVIVGGNTFRKVKTILQWEDIPLLEVIKEADASYGIRLNVYHTDGTKIAVVKDNQIHLTAQGKAGQIKQRFEPNLTVCELEGKPILELRRQGACALKAEAELNAPGGYLVRASDTEVGSLLQRGRTLKFSGWTMQGVIFTGCEIGIHLFRNGAISMSGPGGSMEVGFMRFSRDER